MPISTTQIAVQTAFDSDEQELPNLSQVLTGDCPGTSLSYIGNLTYYPQGDSNYPAETLGKCTNIEPALQIPVHPAPLNFDALAAELLKLPKAERARLVALLLGRG